MFGGGGEHAADTPTGGTLPQSGNETHIPAKQQTNLTFPITILVFVITFTAVVSKTGRKSSKRADSGSPSSHLVSACSNSGVPEPTEAWLSLDSLAKVRFEQLVSRDLVFLPASRADVELRV